MIKDPGKDKRANDWKKPSKQSDRDKLREERIAEYEAINGPIPNDKKGLSKKEEV